MRDPVSHRTEPRGDQAMAPRSTMPLLRYETGIKQDAEVLRDGWAAHLEMSRNRVDGAVSLDEEIEHPATGGMANRPKDIRLRLGSNHHALNILDCATAGDTIARQKQEWSVSMKPRITSSADETHDVITNRPWTQSTVANNLMIPPPLW
jgi:hypothetical protein